MNIVIRKSKRCINLQARNSALPRASIFSTGDFHVGDKPISVTPEQRTLLQAYYGQVMYTVGQGLLVAGKGLLLVLSVCHQLMKVIRKKQTLAEMNAYIENKVSNEITPQSKRITSEHLRKLLSIQNELAASLPEFRPYAILTEEDLDAEDLNDEEGNVYEGEVLKKRDVISLHP